MQSAGRDENHPGRERHILTNVLWSWLGVVCNISLGLLLSPYIIRKLGADGYGIWALLFSFVGYYGLLDMGFRSALVYYTATYRATGERQRINYLINTVLTYYTCGSVILFIGVLLLAGRIESGFHVSPHYRSQFSWLLLLTGVSFVFGMNVFGGCLEAFQRFDLSNRVYVLSLALRAVGSLGLLVLGYGLVALGANMVLVQLFSTALSWWYFKRVFPELRFSFKFVRWRVLRETLDYGVHTFVASIAGLLLNQTGSLLVGLYKPVAFVGYYTLPNRLLQYTVELVSKAGLVTGSKASESTPTATASSSFCP
jgi:O-antigen/teichoic acid export membrane protein